MYFTFDWGFCEEHHQLLDLFPRLVYSFKLIFQLRNHLTFII